VTRSAWTLGAELGRGAFGRTYLAHDTSGRQAVAKVMRVAEAPDWKAIELCEREARVLASLNHPGIPRYLEHYVEDDGVTLVLVMEHISGHTLARPAATIDSAQLTSWLRQALQILAYLHSRVPAVIHRDVTPKNLIVDGERLSLVDFGSVKASLAQSTQATVVGTFGFMAPEQIRGAAEPASDLYGLGMSMLCVAAGVGPEDLPINHATGGVDVGAMPGLSEPVERALRGLVAPGLAARFASAEEALAVLADRPAPRAPLAVVPTQAKGLVVDYAGDSDTSARATIPRVLFAGGIITSVGGVIASQGLIAFAGLLVSSIAYAVMSHLGKGS